MTWVAPTLEDQISGVHLGQNLLSDTGSRCSGRRTVGQGKWACVTLMAPIPRDQRLRLRHIGSVLLMFSLSPMHS